MIDTYHSFVPLRQSFPLLPSSRLSSMSLWHGFYHQKSFRRIPYHASRIVSILFFTPAPLTAPLTDINSPTHTTPKKNYACRTQILRETSYTINRPRHGGGHTRSRRVDIIIYYAKLAHKHPANIDESRIAITEMSTQSNECTCFAAGRGTPG